MNSSSLKTTSWKFTYLFVFSESLGSICWEAITTCPPDLRRTLPTIVFFLLFALMIIGTVASTAVISEVDPNWFILFAYNGFGSLLILVCAVWCIDGLWLAWLFLVVGMVQGKKGEAQNWWWKRRLEDEDEEEKGDDDTSTGNTAVAHGSGEDDSVHSAKSTQLDQDRKSAKTRAGIILIFYSWWTAWALGKHACGVWQEIFHCSS